MSEMSEPGPKTDIPMKFRIRGGKTVMLLPDGTRAIERKEVIVDNAMVTRVRHQIPISPVFDPSTLIKSST